MRNKIIVSAGDAITAKLVDQAGFGGIWISGFEASARLGLPDNGSITITEMLAIAKPIVNATKLPVYVDVDTGYADFARTVVEFESIGCAGVCIEDAIPDQKKNSLWKADTKLMTMKKFGMKIREGHWRKMGSKFMIIARTEALIRGISMSEAKRRAHWYYANGMADMCMIHTRDETGTQAVRIMTKRPPSYPLVIVPTKFPHITNATLFDLGYKMVIWANQTERVKIKATRAALQKLKDDDCAINVEDVSATLDEMKGLTPSG